MASTMSLKSEVYNLLDFYVKTLFYILWRLEQSKSVPCISSEMVGRKWEDLPTDCLVNIFGRVGMDSLILNVPFVCNSWYKATLHPLCWQCLIFPTLSPSLAGTHTLRKLIETYHVAEFSVTAFMKFFIDRSRGYATVIALPLGCTEEALVYASDECPALKTLVLPFDLPENQMALVPKLISKWKNLERLRLRTSSEFIETLEQISTHCKNFVFLELKWAHIGKDEALAIVTFIPRIKYLCLREATIEKEGLLMILKGCKELLHLDVSGCIGFKADEEILKLASFITTFKCEYTRDSLTIEEFWDEQSERRTDLELGLDFGCYSEYWLNGRM